MKKSDIRRAMVAKRNRLVTSVRDEKCQGVYERLINWPTFQLARCVACYVSVQKEVETRGIIEYALDNGKQLAVPVTRAGGVMDFQRISSLAGLQADRFGLLEPMGDDGQIISPGGLDLVIAPGIAFDRLGNRIGFGGGYYDRFLTQTHAIRVGLAYAFQLADLLPAESHDVRMDWLVTENEVISCQTNK